MKAILRALVPLLACGGAAAEVSTDGSLGPALSLPGPDYAITADLGRQAGANLFHSFHRFGIQQGESATFSGPAEVRNVIGRVTGGQQSFIDGGLRSTIPGADLYLLNPAGVLLGEHASLNVGGSLYLSSADHLTLADGTRFSASDPGATVLSVAPPASFGFVSAAPAAVGVDGAQIEVDGGQGITLVGGDLAVEHDARLLAPGGRITLSAASAASEVALDGRITAVDADAGRVRLTDGAVLDASGEGGGRIFIRGGRILAQGASVLSHTTGGQPGRGIRIQGGQSITLEQGSLVQSSTLGSADAGPLALDAPEVTLSGSGLLNSSFGSGAGGTTQISAGRLAISGDSAVYNEARDSGSGGRIHIAVDELRMDGNALISGRSHAAGAGADIEIVASGRVELNGEPVDGDRPFLLATSALDRGASGNIRIQAGELLVRDAVVDVSTEGTGAAGTIDLEIAGRFDSRNGAFQSASNDAGPAGLIRVRAGTLTASRDGGLLALGIGSGAAGSIDVEAQRIELSDGAEFSTEAYLGAAGAGPLRVRAGESLLIRGRSEPDPFPEGSVYGAGRVSTGIFSYTGEVSVSAPEILVLDSGQIAARTHNDLPAGRLSVSAGRISLLNGGQIDGSAIGSSLTGGNAGHVVVTASESIRISGEVDGRYSGIGAASRSSGDAGLIEVTAPLILVEQGGRINTSTGVFTDNSAGGISLQADRVIVRDDGGIVSASVGHAGAGGDILIRAGESIEVSGDSFVSAWGGREGHSGRVTLSAPQVLLSNGRVETTNVGTQKAGDILIQADHVEILDGSEVRSNTTESGDAGSVIVAARLIEADGSRISTEALAASGGNILLRGGTIRLRATPVSATVAGGSGDGGNATLRAGAVAATADSDVTARADQGRGGRILVDADVFLRDATVDLDASSNVAGNEGVVAVNAPEMDVSATIKGLPADYLDADALLRNRCAAGSSAEAGSLVVVGMDRAPVDPDDLLLGMPSDGDGAGR